VNIYYNLCLSVTMLNKKQFVVVIFLDEKNQKL